MVDFGESDMIKISGKVDKLNTYNVISEKISFFIDSTLSIIQTTSQTIKNLTYILKRTNKATTSQADIYSTPCKNRNKKTSSPSYFPFPHRH